MFLSGYTVSMKKIALLGLLCIILILFIAALTAPTSPRNRAPQATLERDRAIELYSARMNALETRYERIASLNMRLSTLIATQNREDEAQNRITQVQRELQAHMRNAEAARTELRTISPESLEFRKLYLQIERSLDEAEVATETLVQLLQNN